MFRDYKDEEQKSIEGVQEIGSDAEMAEEGEYDQEDDFDEEL